MYKEDLALNNPQWLICHKTQRNQILTQFLPGSGRVDTAVWMHHLDTNKTAGEEARR